MTKEKTISDKIRLLFDEGSYTSAEVADQIKGQRLIIQGLVTQIFNNGELKRIKTAGKLVYYKHERTLPEPPANVNDWLQRKWA